MIVLHVDMADEDLKKAVQEAIGGEIKSMTREAMEQIIGETVSEKLTQTFTSGRIADMTNSTIRAVVKEAINNQMQEWVWNQKTIKPEFKALVKETIKEIMDGYLKPFVG